MPAQITELTFLEHLAGRFKLPVPEHLTADAAGAEIREALGRWKGKALVKPDVLAGRRGKAGAVRQVSDYVEAQRELRAVQGSQVAGHLPRTAYLVEYIPAALRRAQDGGTARLSSPKSELAEGAAEMEIYSAITYDSRRLGPALTLSLAGGVDVEDAAGEGKGTTRPVNVYKGLDAYQAGEMRGGLGCPAALVSVFSRTLVDLWDMFASTGMRMCEVNPWRITPEGRPYACDFKAVFDEANFKFKNLGFDLPEYPADETPFEEEMGEWSASSHRGQAHVADLGGDLILPILFGGGASTIIVETLMQNGGSPMFLSDFGGNPPYERMYGTARICFEHNLARAALLLILGGKANNTLIDVTFKAIADALTAHVEEHGPVDIPVVIGRGGPRLVQGLSAMKDALESFSMPYVIFGPDTPVTLVAEYAAGLARACREIGGAR